MQGDLFGQQALSARYAKLFEQAYDNLNSAQRRAVDLIEGPVLVLAGPGTGKTQLIAVRIGKILKETQAQAHNILCLTFTDAATLAMRNRLLQIIGPAAHQVHIFTFHAFCNQVIQENLDEFGHHIHLEPLSDLDRVDLFENLLNELDSDHVLKQLKGDNLYESRRLNNLFSLMKKENLDPDQFVKQVDQFVDKCKDDEEGPFYYKRNGPTFEKGDLKVKTWNDFVRKMTELKAGVYLFSEYQLGLKKLGRYDYQDMILWVLRAFERNEELLASYQERYQYLLVDEFQDTNGSQKDLLKLLISFWADSPNLFVVGDDDQAIFRFQGANLSNIQELVELYRPEVVVLEQNYRSIQPILDCSMTLISQNQDRMVNLEGMGITKDLFSEVMHSKQFTSGPKINYFTNVSQEQAYLFQLLLKESKEKNDLSNTAVIYRKHAQVEKLVRVLEKNNVPVNVRRKVDILHLPLVKNIVNVLEYVNNIFNNKDREESRLYELLHYKFFKLRPDDISKIVLYCSRPGDRTRESIRSVMSNDEIMQRIGVKDVIGFSGLDEKLNSWVSNLAHLTLPKFFEDLINEGGVLKYILGHPESSWNIQVLTTFFDFIQQQCENDPASKLSDVLGVIERMIKHNLPLHVNKVIHSAEGVHFITAHSSKGLEFDRVFVIGVTKDIWDRPMNNRFHFRYPDTVNQDARTDVEDERRLLYVALTRARQELTISYSDQKENGKALGSSRFVDEIHSSYPLSRDEIAVLPSTVTRFQHDTLLKKEQSIQLIDDYLIDQVLERYKLSVTGLNKYLRCPLTFYYESILRVPTAKTKYMGFGKAIHFAMQHYFNELNQGSRVSQNLLTDFFLDGMKNNRAHFTEEEYSNMGIYGKKVLNAYFKKYLVQVAIDTKYHMEVSIDNAEYKGVPLKGVLDKVAVEKTTARVSDFKTGNFSRSDNRKKLKPASTGFENGGDYWRQIVFYKILLDSDRKHSWNMHQGEVDFIEPDRKTGEFYKEVMTVSDQDIQIVGNQITETWKNISEHNFHEGCGEETCHWCNFTAELAIDY